MNQKLFLVLTLTLTTLFTNAQVLINEFSHTNASFLMDEDGNFPDWIELYNAGPNNVDLTGYRISDNLSDPDKWVFPAVYLDNDDHLFIFASGKDRKIVINHWETAVFNSDPWRYLVPVSEPDTNWIYPPFNDNTWLQGAGGIGYGDGDDNTVIASTGSLYMRKTFNITDVNAIAAIALHMDYDDGFVAYLNGVEIARIGIGTVGIRPTWNELAYAGHEATMYQGGMPDEFVLDVDQLNGTLQNGTNVLAIQIYNTDISSSDLTSNAWLSFGLNNSNTQFSTPPAWFPLTASDNLHSNFTIAENEMIVLSDNMGNIIDQITIPYLDIDNSYGSETDGGTTMCSFLNPTPESENGNSACASGYEPTPTFSLDAGAYSNAQTLTLINNSPTAIIHYTTNGNIPTLVDAVYSGPIAVDASMVVSARAFSTAGKLPSPWEKNTYMINEADLYLPVISISTDSLNLWDWNTGIYVMGPNADPNYPHFGSNFWQPWEKLCHVEYFDEQKTQQFEVDAYLSIHGGWSRGQPQKSFRIESSGDLGEGDIDFPLWTDDKPFIEHPKNFNLRNGGNHYGDARFADALMERVMKGTHVDYMSYQPALAFLNGTYFGMYEIREKLDEDWAEDNFGVPSEQVDCISDMYYGFVVHSGSDSSFWPMYDLVTQTDPTTPTYYEGVNQCLDIKNFVDYLIAETYYANTDWMNGWVNNIKFWKPTFVGGKFRFMLMDMDFGMGYSDANTNMLALTRDEGWKLENMFNALLQNTQFFNYFVDRYADLINTKFQRSYIEPVGIAMRDQISSVMDRHCTTWGTSYWNYYYTLDNMLNWNDVRIPGARNMIQTEFALPQQVIVTLDVSPPGAGKVHISTIMPETYPWNGVYFKGVPVTLTAVPNPGFVFDHWQPNSFWSANNSNQEFTLDINQPDNFTAVFTGSAQGVTPIVTEINYNSDSTTTSGDWFEMYNPLSVPFDLTGWYFKDQNALNTFTFPVGTTISGNGYLVVVKDSLKFDAQFPSVNNRVGNFLFGLSNLGDAIRIYDALNTEYTNIVFDDSLPWPRGCDGCGRTYEVKDYFGTQNDPTNWFAGCMGGSPGGAYSICNDDIVYSEINYNSALSLQSGNWVELWNTTANPIDLSNWILRDQRDTNTFVVPAGTTIGANNYLVIGNNSAQFYTLHQWVPNFIGDFDFDFGNGGDCIRLFGSDSKLRFSVNYDDQYPWPSQANGLGYTLELLQKDSVMNDGLNWFAGCLGGSPGYAYDPDCIVGIEDLNSFIAQLLISPVPSDGDVQIQIITINQDADFTLSVFDVTGRKMKEFDLKGNQSVTVPAGDLSKGVYFVQLNGENIHVMGKMMIE